MNSEIESLSHALHAFADFVHSLPAAKLEPRKGKPWGPREVLIHLVFWHEQYAQIAAEVLTGKRREMLRGTFKQINDWAVSQNAAASVEDLLACWATAQMKLLRISRRPEAVRLKFSLREGSKEWPFAVLMRLAAGHISNHEAKLRKALGMHKRATRSAALI